MNRSLSELATRLGAELAVSGDLAATGFATDNRQVKPGDLFLAIRGANVDGHDFAEDAIERGAVAVLSERFLDVPHLRVPNLVEALAKMALSIRNEFAGPVIGVTGSAGKTTAKEFIASALRPVGPVLKTEGNRNSEYTAPLLWAELQDHRVAVVELAMRGFGQIAHLAAFSKPTVGVVTNVGYSHMEMVGDRAGVAQAKGELLEALPPSGVGIVWAEDDYLETLRAKAPRIRTFGTSEGADCRILGYQVLNFAQAAVSGVLNGREWKTTMPAIGRHLALNVAAAVLAASEVGMDPAEAASFISYAKLPSMRMEVKEWRGIRVILDAYNAAPPAVLAALETLDDLPCDGHRLAILGQMNELGDQSEEAHREVGRALAASRVERAVLFGELAGWVFEGAVEAGAAPGSMHLAKSLDEVRAFFSEARPKDVILVKGSRSLALETALPEELRT